MLVKGFVSNMAEWMSACNVIVTKAGPGTIAEALICGLPILLNGFIPCQAWGICACCILQNSNIHVVQRPPAPPALCVL